MILFKMLHPRMTEEILGLIPEMLSLHDGRGAREQLDSAYRHGGGWQPFVGFKLTEGNTLTYPGDPPMKPLARAHLRDETILFYDHSFVMVLQKDGTFEVCRMD